MWTLFAGLSLETNAVAAVVDGYTDNPCTGKITSIYMIYNTTNTPNKGQIIWMADGTGPTVEYKIEMTCQDGQYGTSTLRSGANTWVPLYYNHTAYMTSGGIYNPQPAVTLLADGNLSFKNGWERGVFTTVPKIASSNKVVQEFIVRYWNHQARRDTPEREIQTWSSTAEAQAAINDLPKYDPYKLTVTNAYSKLYPAYPWINGADNPYGELYRTPRPMIRISYNGPTGTATAAGPAKYVATVYCFPGQGDNDFFNRPVIVSDAFDPKNERSAYTIYSDQKYWRLLSRYNPTAVPVANGSNSPRSLGYDMFFVDFHQGGGDILINAALFLKAVEWMHSRTLSPIIVGGPSMGGQVPRLALLYSIPENNVGNGPGVVGRDLASRVKGYLSIDSPHQGASISATFQQTIHTVSQDWRVNTLAGVTGQDNNAKDGWMQLSVPAAHQMLYAHYYPSLGAPSSKAHDGFYDFMKSLGSGKTLGDPRGYRKDMAKVSIAYSNFNPPMRTLDETRINHVGKLEIVNTNIQVEGVPLRLSWNLWAGGPANDTWGRQYEFMPGSVIKDQCWGPYNKKAQKFSYPIVVNSEHYAGTFMPIQSVLDLTGIDPLRPHTKNEKELAAYSPFDAVFYMRDDYNDYARVKNANYTGPVSVTPDDSRYEHIVFDDQCMTAIMRGLKVIEDAPTAKTVTGPITEAGGTMFTLLGSSTSTTDPTVLKVPFGFGNRAEPYFGSYPTFLDNTLSINLWDGLLNLYEGKFDMDGYNDVMVVQGRKGTPNLVFKNDEDTYVAKPHTLTYPEMSHTTKISVGDFNGDHLDDILTLGNVGQKEILVAFSDRNGSFTLKRQLAADFTSSAMLPEVKVVTGDFNRDGMADIVLVGGNDWNNIRVAWSNGDGTFRFQNFADPGYFNIHVRDKGTRVMVGTFQAPDVLGIAVVYGPRIQVVSFSSGSVWDTDALLGAGTLPFGDWMRDPTATILTGDFNGDRRTDIALTGGKGWSSIPVALATGNGNFRVSNAGVASFPGWASLSNVQISMADPDVDGKADIVLTGGIGWTTVPVAFSNGDGTFDIRNDAGGDLAARSQKLGNKKVTNMLSMKR